MNDRTGKLFFMPTHQQAYRSMDCRAGLRANRRAVRENRRSGFTLIELLLVLSMLSTLLGGTIGLLALVHNSNDRGQQNLLHRQEIRRFADDVRRDMHASSAAEIRESELILMFASPESKIVYRADGGSLLRRQTSGTDESPAGQDQYRIDDKAMIAVDWLEQGTQVRWTITPTDRPHSPVQIIASKRLTQ
tara:strand:- start:969 stop:1541 length:573 start_codon:yes stop_codon:yes gene_type:complete